MKSVLPLLKANVEYIEGRYSATCVQIGGLVGWGPTEEAAVRHLRRQIVRIIWTARG